MAHFNYKTDSDNEVVIRYSSLKAEDETLKVSRDFLHKLMKEFARLSMNYFQPKYHACFMPYYYSERRLDSIVLPAISKICDGLVLTELGVERSDKMTGETIGNGHGRADYWCIYKGYSFIIEMKGSKDRYDCKTVRQNSIVNRWGKMINQLESAELDCKGRHEKTKGVIRIGLHFVTSFAKGIPTDESIALYRSTINNYMDKFYDRIHEEYHKVEFEPTYMASWLIPDDIIKCSYREKEDTYAGVMLMAKVFKAI